MSIRKNHYKLIGRPWDRKRWDIIASRMADAMFEMRFLPPGRGLWAMGTNYIYERGSASLNNCGFVQVTDLARDVAWAMDMLMCGVGVGFSTGNWHQLLFQPAGLLTDFAVEEADRSVERYKVYDPRKRSYSLTPEGQQLADHLYQQHGIFIIPDSREGWTQSVANLIDAYLLGGRPKTRFVYSLIRPSGSPIDGFGGTASGPGPLIELHGRIEAMLEDHLAGLTSQTRLVADVMNAIGCCVVAGNVRRSAELTTGSIHDEEFLNLKNYDLYPERAAIGWMSNNSVVLRDDADFDALPLIAERIRDNGEPGVINLANVQKYGRFKEKKPDLAVGFNPCAEIPLESYELCNLAEVFPTRCRTKEEYYEANELATIYDSTVALLPCHDPLTQAVIERNRRIGVSGSGLADWLDASHVSHLTRMMRTAYERIVEPTNHLMAVEANVPSSVRLTTVKPSGTVSQLAGVSPGMHWPVYRHGIRRMRVSDGSVVAERLIAAGVPHEPDSYSSGTLVFEFPTESGQGKTRSVDEVSVWEQASMVAFLQREWADNAVSNTLTFDPNTEGKDIERVIAAFAPQIKSISLLPDIDKVAANGGQVYAQAPYERTTRDEYRRRMKEIQPIDWSSFTGSDGQDSRFCNNDSCEI